MFETETKEDLARSNKDQGAGSQTCESAAYIPMTVSAPINLQPMIKQLPIRVSICENPVLEQRPCGKYILIQELCVQVPIEISVEPGSGKQSSCCGCIPREGSQVGEVDEESYWGRCPCGQERRLGTDPQLF